MPPTLNMPTMCSQVMYCIFCVAYHLKEFVKTENILSDIVGIRITRYEPDKHKGSPILDFEFWEMKRLRLPF